MQTDPIPGFICAYGFDSDGRGQALSAVSEMPAPKGRFSWTWLHLNLTDWRCRRWLADRLAIPIDDVNRYADVPSRQMLLPLSGVICGHLADFQREFDHDSTEFAWLHVLMGETVLVTGRVKAVQSAERMRTEIGRGRRLGNPGEFLMQLIGNYPDTLDAALHRLTDELELIEDQVLSEQFRGERRRLMLARRETAHLHRHMRSLRRALVLAVRDIPGLPEGLGLIASRLIALDQDFEAMEARARFFHDEIDAKLAAETNRQLYILSALTAAFLPPTLVAGLFGMNLRGIPWDDSSLGFWIALALATLSSGLVILYLRHAGKS